MDIYLIRHTRVTGVDGICYGRTDVPLAEGFEAEAEAVRARLPDPETLTVLSSPSERCLRLAHFLGGPRARICPELMELDFGSWEGRAWDSIPREDLDRWGNDFLETPCPGGESLRQLEERVLSFWNTLTRGPGGDHVVVSHGGPIRVILSRVLGRPPLEMFSFPVDFGGVYRIRNDAGMILI